MEKGKRSGAAGLMQNNKLILVGAGPGDPDLITVKALKTLALADVVLYDHLANADLLAHCRADCEKIYVGKQGHKRGISQDKINQLIVQKVLEKGLVVRLKGGDPFVFGRGVEEVNHVLSHGIDWEYIPGVSSVNAIGLAGVPLTDRNLSDGYWVITGHKKDGSLSSDVLHAARSNATMVILMGMSKLAEISETLVNAGHADKPAAILQQVATKYQKASVGKASDLVQMAERNAMKNPAIIVIGDVVKAIGANGLEVAQKHLRESA